MVRDMCLLLWSPFNVLVVLFLEREREHYFGLIGKPAVSVWFPGFHFWFDCEFILMGLPVKLTNFTSLILL